MKRIFKSVFIAIFFTAVFAASNLNAQNQNSGIGLKIGLDYISNYMTRGEYVFGNTEAQGGYFFPSAFFDVFGTGLTLGIRGEIHEAWIGGRSEEKEFAGQIRQLHSVDFNADYVYSIKEIVTFDLGGWYYRYKTPTSFYGEKYSYFDFYISAALDAVPLTPTVALTYSHYTNKAFYRGFRDDGSGNRVPADGKNGDWYLQLGIEHSFELATATYFDLEGTVGFSRNNAIQPKSDDISDIDLSAGISTTQGIVTLMSAFHYVIVPGTQLKYYEKENGEKIKDIHRFYARFGVSVSI